MSGRDLPIVLPIAWRTGAGLSRPVGLRAAIWPTTPYLYPEVNS